MTAEDTTTLTSARLDLWLWSVRIFKTRSLAADECKGGHVRVNDAPAKPDVYKRQVRRVPGGSGCRMHPARRAVRAPPCPPGE